MKNKLVQIKMSKKVVMLQKTIFLLKWTILIDKLIHFIILNTHF